MLTAEQRREKYYEKHKKEIPNVPTRSIHCYCRVSTTKQVEDGHSIDAQKQELIKCVNDNNIQGTIIWYIDEALSGKNMIDRPDFNRMIAAANSGDTIVTYSMSRLGRDTKDILTFMDEMHKKNINIVCIKDKIDLSTASGKAMCTMMAAFATLERDLAVERSRTVLEDRKNKGYVTGRVPFGYRSESEIINGKKQKKLVEDPDEQDVINFISVLIGEDPKIKDAEITRRLKSEVLAGRLKMRNSKDVYQSFVSRIIKTNNLRDIIINPALPPQQQ